MEASQALLDRRRSLTARCRSTEIARLDRSVASGWFSAFVRHVVLGRSEFID